MGTFLLKTDVVVIGRFSLINIIYLNLVALQIIIVDSSWVLFGGSPPSSGKTEKNNAGPRST